MDATPDALSAALEELGLRCEPILDRAEDTGVWRREFPRGVVSLHVVVQGECFIDADLPLWRRRLERGEVLVVNGKLPGLLRPTCEHGTPPDVLSTRIHLSAPHGHPMLDALPPLIRTRPKLVPRSFGPTVEALLEELAVPLVGQRTVVGLLCEVIFVEALRDHLTDDLSWTDKGWFRALADPLLRQALGSTDPIAGSVAALASAAGRSSRRIGSRFVQFAGTRPSILLRKARVRRAAELLRKGEANLERIAALTCFGSRQALARAFRRDMGTSPTDYWRAVHLRPFPRAPTDARGVREALERVSSSFSGPDPPEPE